MEVIDKLGLIIIENRKVLYARSRGKGLFFNLGGKREAGESDIDALAREVREEASVDIDPGSVRHLSTFEAQAHGKPEGTTVRLACFLARYTGTLAPAAEVEELAWFTSADLERTTVTGQMVLAWLKERDFID